MGSKPPAAVSERISKDGRHNLGAAAPSSTKTSSLQGRSGGLAIMPKLVELVFGPGSVRQAEKLFPCIICTAVAAPSVRSRVLVFADPSASMTRRGCRASCYRLASRRSIAFISSGFSGFLSPFFSQTSSHVSHIIRRRTSSVIPGNTYWGMGPLLSETAPLSFRGILG